MQGGNVNLQGGTGINVGNSNPQQLQPAAPVQSSSGQIALQGTQNAANQGSNIVNQAQSQFNSSQNQISALLKSIQSMEQANAPGTPASINVNALRSQAQSQASNSVNPLYTQYLNQYLQEEAANQQAAQAQNTLNVQGAQTSLGNTLAQNTLQEQAAGKTNALTQGNINVQQQNYQLQSGNAQNAKIQAISQNVGTGNLGGSGIGQQQLYEAENAHNIADAAQSGQFQYQRDTSNLSTQDTFAQLAQSSKYATTAEGQQESQLNFNLNDYLRQAAYNDTQYRQSLEAQRQQAITAGTQNYLAQNIQNAIGGSGASGKNLVATNQAYSPYLQTTAMPSVSELASLGNTFSTGNFGASV